MTAETVRPQFVDQAVVVSPFAQDRGQQTENRVLTLLRTLPYVSDVHPTPAYTELIDAQVIFSAHDEVTPVKYAYLQIKSGTYQYNTFRRKKLGILVPQQNIESHDEVAKRRDDWMNEHAFILLNAGNHKSRGSNTTREISDSELHERIERKINAIVVYAREHGIVHHADAEKYLKLLQSYKKSSP